MSNRQEIPFKTLWAENAETTIPATPVIGDSYRDEATTDVTIGDGWAYGDPVPSQSENQYNYIQSLIARQLSEQGILSYSDKEDYSASVGAVVMDDGLPYLCLQDNGPTSAVKQPSTEPLYWFQFGITQVENRLKGNQVPVVEGGTGDPLPSTVATAYATNSEPAAGYEFVTAATNVTFDAGLWKGTGQLQRKYKRDAAGFISKTSEYTGVRLHDDTQLRALVDDIATNGCSVTDDVDYVYVTFELSDFPNGVKFPFIAAEVGTIAEIGEDESTANQLSVLTRIFESSGTYTPTPGAKAAELTLVGGGGGAGCAAGGGAGTTALTAGGAGGATSIKLITALESSYSVVIGVGGAGGAGGAVSGDAGGSSSFIGDDTATTNMTAGGGNGSTGKLGVAGSSRLGGPGGGVASGGDLNIDGGYGSNAIVVSGSVASSPDGGASAVGTSVRGRANSDGGINATSYGGGGGGAAAINESLNRKGGDGFQGVCRIREYF